MDLSCLERMSATCVMSVVFRPCSLPICLICACSASTLACFSSKALMFVCTPRNSEISGEFHM